MLETLDTVDWASYEHAYGAADDVPQLLRELVSSNEEERKQSLYQLYGNIWHQGTIYEATVQALPFLLEILEGVPPEQQEDIAGLVASIIAGNGYWLVHAPLFTPPDDIDVDAVIQQELDVIRAVCTIGKSAIPHLSRFLSVGHPETRATVAYAFDRLKEPGNNLTVLLAQSLESEQHPEVRQAIEAALK